MLALCTADDFFPAMRLGVLEGKFGDTRRSLLGDDLQALHDARDDFMFDAGIKPFGILAHDHQVDVLITRFDPGQILDRPQIGIEIESLAQLDIDAAKSFAHRRRHRPFESDLGLVERIHQRPRDGRPMFFQSLGAGQMGIPINFCAGGFDDFQCRLDYFGTDPIARNQRNFMRHDNCPFVARIIAGR